MSVSLHGLDIWIIFSSCHILGAPPACGGCSSCAAVCRGWRRSTPSIVSPACEHRPVMTLTPCAEVVTLYSSALLQACQMISRVGTAVRRTSHSMPGSNCWPLPVLGSGRPTSDAIALCRKRNIRATASMRHMVMQFSRRLMRRRASERLVLYSFTCWSSHTDHRCSAYVRSGVSQSHLRMARRQKPTRHVKSLKSLRRSGTPGLARCSSKAASLESSLVCARAKMQMDRSMSAFLPSSGTSEFLVKFGPMLVQTQCDSRWSVMILAVTCVSAPSCARICTVRSIPTNRCVTICFQSAHA